MAPRVGSGPTARERRRGLALQGTAGELRLGPGPGQYCNVGEESRTQREGVETEEKGMRFPRARRPRARGGASGPLYNYTAAFSEQGGQLSPSREEGTLSRTHTPSLCLSSWGRR